ncbi:M4 family metallopeptidase [Archangium primigenium]|uniref:M4 family metallopeptidase n=1 Tax=[Archangium] primigenium TaxID=2792470 RepID=UPI0030843775
MVRTPRFLAAALLALPLAACEVDPSSQLSEESSKKVTASDSLGDIHAALAALPSAQIAGAEQNGVPFMITGKLGVASGAVKGLAADGNGRLSQALPGIAAAFRVNASDLIAKRSRTDEQGVTHVRYGQTKNGLPVVNEELIVHIGADNTIIAANGTARDGEIVSAKARISEEAAKAAALDSTSGRHLEQESIRLVYVRSPADEKLKLAYESTVIGEARDGMPIRDLVYVSAQDGGIVTRNSKIHTALNRAVYTAANKTSLPGTLKRSEGGAATGDNHVDKNYEALGGTYNCYKNNFGRDSLDNKGALLKSTVHYDSNYTNAFWNGTQMVYGDSNGTQSLPLGLSADVTTHELTHAVTENESNLTYSAESGGLNEAMSDIFGAYCESYASGAWSTSDAVFMVGDDVWTPNTAGDALRYMFDPAKDGASHDYWTTSTKSVDVHYSSGVANLAFTLLSRGGKHPRNKSTITVPALGVQKAGAIYYKANTDLFTASTNYAQAKTYLEQAASTLYGAGSAEVAAVTASLQAVGVGVSTPAPTATALTNGVAKTSLGASSGASLYYYLDVPASKASTFTTSGGTGDLDLYVKASTQPTTTSYDCRSEGTTNAESCTISAKTAATRIYVTLYAYTTFSGVTLKGSYP